MFWGRVEVGEKKNFGQSGCGFGSSPKRVEWPHPQLVHWWLLIHSSHSSLATVHIAVTVIG
jgi:hypothetical protein